MLYFFEIPLFAITLILSIVYIILLSNIMDGWDGTPEWEIPDHFVPSSKISIIIAARNEEKHIKKCIDSILNNIYPADLFEIIIVNDHSDDNTESIVRNVQRGNVRLLHLEKRKGKKNALELGIHHAKGNLIACTDADCEVPQHWLLSFASYFESHNSKFIAGPIKYECNRTILQRFQFLDSINNMCVTANGILKKSYFMANGANMFFEKEVFDEIGGYHEKNELASGDDMFLIQKIADRYPQNVHFLKSKEAIVSTQPETSLKSLMAQRTRWATKSKSYANKKIIQIQGLVFVFVLVILANLLLSPFGAGLSLFGFLLALFIKWTMDYLYLSKMSDFFEERDPLKSFFAASLGFLAYILFAGWKALMPTEYQWKDRNTK